MGVLTYVFAHLGPHPLDQALAAPEAPAVRHEPARPAATTQPTVPEPVAAEPSTTGEPAIAVERPVAAPEASAEAEPAPKAETPPDERRAREPGSEARRAREPELAASSPLAFPDFTDSSRPARREHAADGPRIDSLFEKATERSEAEPAMVAPPEGHRDAPVVTSSCEAAVAHNSEQLEIGGPRGPADISREAYASILQNGRYLSACEVPARTVFEICAAVKDGHAVGITVVSNPTSAALNACVRRAVSRLSFPPSPRLDVTHTRFDAQSH